MNENQTPWAAAADAMKPQRNDAGWSLLGHTARIELIREACERHAADLRAENERLSAQLKHANDDAAEDDTAIRDLCRKLMGDVAVDGDSYGVPSLVYLTEKLCATNAALAARVEQFRKALANIRDNGPPGWVHAATQQALSDAPPPTVVPAVEVEPLISLMETFLQWTRENLPGAEFDPQHILDAYRKKHPKPESKP